MSVPYFQVNSMSYTYSAGITNGVLNLNTSYAYLRGGGSFSLAGLTQTLYYSATNSYGVNITNTFSIHVPTASSFNLTFSFYKGPYYNYPFAQPTNIGITQAGSSSVFPYGGGYAYNTGFATFSSIGLLYEINRTYNYTFNNI